LLAAACAWAGQNEDARHELTLVRVGQPDFSVALFELPYADEAHRKHIQDGLRMAGLTE